MVKMLIRIGTRHSLLTILLASVFVFPISVPSHASTATERAGEIKLWRDYCNDPDPDLRNAYVEEAIATKGVAIKRICIRQAIESGNADIRNLGLRAAIAQNSSITFRVEKPPELIEAYKDVVGDKAAIAKLDKSFVSQDFANMQLGLTFVIKSASVAEAQSTWLPLGSLSKPDERYGSGTATIVGDTINWVGSAYLSNSSRSCRLKAKLEVGGRLKGFFQCADLWGYAVDTELL